MPSPNSTDGLSDEIGCFISKRKERHAPHPHTAFEGTATLTTATLFSFIFYDSMAGHALS